MMLPYGPVFKSARTRRRALLWTGVIGVSAIITVVGVRRYAPWVTDPEAVRNVISGFGTWAPVAFVGLQALQVILAPVPGQLLGIVGGYLFGWVQGTLYSMLGVTIGSYAVIRLARSYGRPAVERWVDDAVLERFDGFVQRNGVVALFVIYLLPTFPDDAVCAVAGLTELRIRTLLVLVVIGRTPSFLVVAYVGMKLADADYRALGGVLAVTGVLSLVIYLSRDRIRRGVKRVRNRTE